MAASHLSRVAIIAATILSLVQTTYSTPQAIAEFIPALDLNYPQIIVSNSTLDLDNRRQEALSQPASTTSTPKSISVEHIVELRVRQFLTNSGSSTTAAGGCPNNFNACGNLNAPGVCCTNTAVCTVDRLNHIACCPSGSTCTGTIAVSTQSGSSVSSISVPQGAATGTFTFVGVVSNAAYTMGVLPTSFPNAAVCSQAYSTCQSQYSNCLNQLGGNGAGRTDGLTISAPGGGTTVLPGGTAASTTATDASALCSSLSQSACMGLETQFCPAYGGSLGTGSSSGSTNAARSQLESDIVLAILATLAAVILAGASFSMSSGGMSRRE